MWALVISNLPELVMATVYTCVVATGGWKARGIYETRRVRKMMK